MNPLRHVLSVDIRTTPEALWDALTKPEFTRQYFHQTEVESTWQRGAPFEYRMTNGAVAARGEVLESDPPRRLVISWRFDYSPDVASDPPSRVTFEIVPKGALCTLTVVHDDFASETNTYKAVGGGWPKIIASLKNLLETGVALPVE
ncbi:MAG: SRPBCC family protein [Phycisphaerae bacterium]